MSRFMILMGAALLAYALTPAAAQAQVIYVQSGRPYAPPIIITQSGYYGAPSYYAPPITTYRSSYSYSYYPPTTTYYAPRPIVSYSAPATYVGTAAGVVETRTYYGFGIFRPRGYYSESRFYP